MTHDELFAPCPEPGCHILGLHVAHKTKDEVIHRKGCTLDTDHIGFCNSDGFPKEEDDMIDADTDLDEHYRDAKAMTLEDFPEAQYPLSYKEAHGWNINPNAQAYAVVIGVAIGTFLAMGVTALWRYNLL